MSFRMIRTSWEKPLYSSVAGANRGGGGGLAGGNRVNNAQGEGVVDNPETINRGAVDLLRDDQRGRQATAKFLFNQRLRMEEKRRYLAKGNIVTFLFENTVFDRMSHAIHPSH